MLNVWSVCVGDKYPIGYVLALKKMVADNLTIEHQFNCITTHKIDGVNCIKPFLPYSGWWSKLNLFSPRVPEGPNIYFDLDVIITGNIDFLYSFALCKFAAPENWAQSGHGGIQSSVMAWNGTWRRPFEEVQKQWPDIRKRLWGDQEFYWELLGDDWIRIPGIGSYKYHCKNGLPKELKVITFHGKPDYHEVDAEWIRQASGGWYR